MLSRCSGFHFLAPGTMVQPANRRGKFRYPRRFPSQLELRVDRRQTLKAGSRALDPLKLNAPADWPLTYLNG